MNGIRWAAHALSTVDLSSYTLYSMCEPSPMCLVASHWARIDRVVFGATIDDALSAGFNELRVASADMAMIGGSRLIVEGGLLREPCAALFDEWVRFGHARSYLRRGPPCRPS